MGTTVKTFQVPSAGLSTCHFPFNPRRQCYPTAQSRRPRSEADYRHRDSLSAQGWLSPAPILCLLLGPRDRGVLWAGWSLIPRHSPQGDRAELSGRRKAEPHWPRRGATLPGHTRPRGTALLPVSRQVRQRAVPRPMGPKKGPRPGNFSPTKYRKPWSTCLQTCPLSWECPTYEQRGNSEPHPRTKDLEEHPTPSPRILYTQPHLTFAPVGGGRVWPKD